MYARFFTKALYDLGLVGFREPFARLFNQGMIYRFGAKMSKSKGNVVSPDELIERFGADALRLYILFMGPADQDKEWQDTGVEGTSRFVQRLWRVVHEELEREPTGVTTGTAARAQGARDDREGERRHRAPVRLQHAGLGGDGARERAVEDLRRPGVAVRRRDGGVADPAVRAARRRGALVARSATRACGRSHGPSPTSRSSSETTIELVVQVNGKVRDRIQVAAGLPDDELIALAKASEKVQAHLNGEEPQRVRRAGQARQLRRVGGRFGSLLAVRSPGNAHPCPACSRRRWFALVSRTAPPVVTGRTDRLWISRHAFGAHP